MINHFSHFSHPKKEVSMGAKITVVKDNRELVERVMIENSRIEADANGRYHA